jgi:predicted HicB family RNase H-like nuclease
MKQLSYKGYTGSIEYSKDEDLFFGKVLGIQSLISFEGKTGKALEKDFKEAIDDYLETCKVNGLPPEKAFKGNFNVRISPQLHYKAAILAKEENISLNNFVADSIREKIQKESGAI